MSNSILRFRLSVKKLEQYLYALFDVNLNHHEYALDFLTTSPSNTTTEQQQSLLERIFTPVDLYGRNGPVPKHRRTRERKMQRHFGEHAMKRFIDIKTNLIMCLECGHWHEKRTICGNCYEKVREETKEMKEALGEGLHYTPDQKEVGFVYQEESSSEYEGKHIVEMPKPRPKWFSDSLMTKVKQGRG